MNIIVSAFLTNINKNSKSIQTYIDFGNKLLLENVNKLKIVFIERDIYITYFSIIDKVYTFNYENKLFEFIMNKNIIFVFFERTDNYLYNYIDKITNFNIITDNPNKDTIEYMFLQCHKTEWVKMAIQLITHIKNEHIVLNLTDNLQFIWIDFGIYHIFNNNNELFQNSFENVSVIKYDSIKSNKVRIASCVNPMEPYHSNIYRHIAWYFAGGVFGGSSETLLQFADLMKTECINIINERKHLMWEVNIWYLIYLKHTEFFDPYFCGHDFSIIENY